MLLLLLCHFCGLTSFAFAFGPWDFFRRRDCPWCERVDEVPIFVVICCSGEGVCCPGLWWFCDKEVADVGLS